LTLTWVLWIFGLSTTLLLVGLWGRAVTVDQDTISRSTEAALSADIVTNRVYDWLGDGLASSTGISQQEADRVLGEIRTHPEAIAAVDAIVDDFVAALVAPPGFDTTIDVAGALAPLVPTVVSELDAQGIDVPAETVAGAVDSLNPVALDVGETIPVGTVTEQARAILTRGVLIAAALLTISGLLAVVLSEERWSTARSLTTRIAFSALSFAVLFRVGGWALDPDGGRSPLRRSGAILVESNLNVFIIVAGVAAAAAMIMWSVRSTPTPANRVPTVPAAVDDPADTETQELVSV
jgi:hypothetical protein